MDKNSAEGVSLHPFSVEQCSLSCDIQVNPSAKTTQNAIVLSGKFGSGTLFIIDMAVAQNY